MSRVAIRPLTIDDLSFGHRLSTAAGWNQLLADWERVVALDPSASFIGSLDGVDVGTVTAVAFDSIAWVGLMLVEPQARGKGVGRALMERVLDVLDVRRVRSIRLDATPLGRPLYEKLGFHEDFALHRYAGTASPPQRSDTMVQDLRIVEATSADLPRIADLDEQVTATRRRLLLERLQLERPSGGRIALRGDRLAGFGLERSGRLGTLVGPCCGDSDAGSALLTTSLESLAGTPVLADIPDAHHEARALVTRHGLEAVRLLTRMTRGEPVREDVARLWTTSGPEKG